MKSRFGYVFVAGLIAALGLVGCGEKANDWGVTELDGGTGEPGTTGASGGLNSGTGDTGGSGGNVGTDGTGGDGTGSDTSSTDNGEGTEPGTDTTEGTDTADNPCPANQHAACYGEEVWCHDSTGTPKTQLDICESGEQCVVLSSDVAECQCMKNATQQCYNGDVWSYDSCGEFDSLVEGCEAPKVCSNISETTAGCCEPKVKKQCGVDGNIHWFDSCGEQGDVFENCDGNRACANIGGNKLGCVCRNNWTGENCDVCPLGWDTDKDCGECAGSWTGGNCDVCEGFGDRCQCPNSTFAPQPGTDRCWTCLIPGGADAQNGLCRYVAFDAEGVDWKEAPSKCPEGFRLPTKNEYSLLYNDCVEEDGVMICASCEASSVCSQMFFTPRNSVWVQDECDEGRETFYMSSGAYTNKCIETDEKLFMHCISDN